MPSSQFWSRRDMATNASQSITYCAGSSFRIADAVSDTEDTVIFLFLLWSLLFSLTTVFSDKKTYINLANLKRCSLQFQGHYVHLNCKTLPIIVTQTIAL